MPAFSDAVESDNLLFSGPQATFLICREPFSPVFLAFFVLFGAELATDPLAMPSPFLPAEFVPSYKGGLLVSVHQ